MLSDEPGSLAAIRVLCSEALSDLLRIRNAAFGKQGNKFVLMHGGKNRVKPTRDHVEPAGDYVPPRWASYRRRGRRADVWLTSRPARLLVWWGGLFLVGAVGLTLIILSFFTAGWLLTLGIILLVPTWLNLAPDIRYIPRGWRAWRTLDKG